MLLVIYVYQKLIKINMLEDILKVPYAAFNEDWNLLQYFLKLRSNPRYIIFGDVDLDFRTDIFDLGNLVGVKGSLSLWDSSIESLGELEEVDQNLWLSGCKNITTLGKLKKVNFNLYLNYSSIESLGKLEEVGMDLYIGFTKIPKSELNKVKVKNFIYNDL
jgi:hypothetical protein